MILSRLYTMVQLFWWTGHQANLPLCLLTLSLEFNLPSLVLCKLHLVCPVLWVVHLGYRAVHLHCCWVLNSILGCLDQLVVHLFITVLLPLLCPVVFCTHTCHHSACEHTLVPLVQLVVLLVPLGLFWTLDCVLWLCNLLEQYPIVLVLRPV